MYKKARLIAKAVHKGVEFCASKRKKPRIFNEIRGFVFEGEI